MTAQSVVAIQNQNARLALQLAGALTLRNACYQWWAVSKTQNGGRTSARELYNTASSIKCLTQMTDRARCAAGQWSPDNDSAKLAPKNASDKPKAGTETPKGVGRRKLTKMDLSQVTVMQRNTKPLLQRFDGAVMQTAPPYRFSNLTMVSSHFPPCS